MFVKIFLGCFVIFDKLSEKYADQIESKIKKSHFSWNSRVGKIIKYGCAIIAVGSIVGLLLYDIFGGEKVKTENLIGLAGLFAYILISLFFYLIVSYYLSEFRYNYFGRSTPHQFSTSYLGILYSNSIGSFCYKDNSRIPAKASWIRFLN